MHTTCCLDSLPSGYCHVVFLCCQLWIFINVVMGIAEMRFSSVVAKLCSIWSRFNFMEPLVHVSCCPPSIHFLWGRRAEMRTVRWEGLTASIWNPRSVPHMLLFPIPHLVALLWIPLSPQSAAHSAGWLSKGDLQTRFCSLFALKGHSSSAVWVHSAPDLSYFAFAICKWKYGQTSVHRQ